MQKKIGTENVKSAGKRGGDAMAGRNEEKIYSSMKSLEEWAFAGVSENSRENSGTLGMPQPKG